MKKKSFEEIMVVTVVQTKVFIRLKKWLDKLERFFWRNWKCDK